MVLGAGHGAHDADAIFGALALKISVYEHDGFDSGAARWKEWRLPWHPPGRSYERRKVGSGWQGFKQIVPVADGGMVAVTEDGRLLYYLHKGYTIVPTGHELAKGRFEEHWDGPIEIGTGWQSFVRTFAVLPAIPDVR